MNTEIERHPTGRSLSVTVIDDHALARWGIAAMLEQVEFVDAIDVRPTQAISDIDVTADIAIIGWHPSDATPPVADLDAAHRALLIHTTDPAALVGALQHGADGYLIAAELTPERLRDALIGLAGGDLPLPPALRRCLLDIARTPPSHERGPARDLTYRELEVLDLLATGMSNIEIAAQLSIGRNAVKRHVSRILVKLGCHNRTEAAHYAHTHYKDLPQ